MHVGVRCSIGNARPRLLTQFHRPTRALRLSSQQLTPINLGLAALRQSAPSIFRPSCLVRGRARGCDRLVNVVVRLPISVFCVLLHVHVKSKRLKLSTALGIKGKGLARKAARNASAVGVPAEVLCSAGEDREQKPSGQFGYRNTPGNRETHANRRSRRQKQTPFLICFFRNKFVIQDGGASRAGWLAALHRGRRMLRCNQHTNDSLIWVLNSGTN